MKETAKQHQAINQQLMSWKGSERQCCGPTICAMYIAFQTFRKKSCHGTWTTVSERIPRISQVSVIWVGHVGRWWRCRSESLPKKTILDNWFPISQVTARTYQHNEKLPQTQSEQEPQSAYIAKISQLQSLEFKQKKNQIKSSTHPSVRRRTSLNRSALRYLGWKYRRSRDHNLGFLVNFSLFPYRGFTLKDAEACGLQHQIFKAYADFYTPFVSLCVFDSVVATV